MRGEEAGARNNTSREKDLKSAKDRKRRYKSYSSDVSVDLHINRVPCDH